MLIEENSKKIQKSWKISKIRKVVDVMLARHISDEGNLNPSEILRTIVRCFQNDMIYTRKAPENFVVEHLIQFYREEFEHYQNSGID